MYWTYITGINRLNMVKLSTYVLCLSYRNIIIHYTYMIFVRKEMYIYMNMHLYLYILYTSTVHIYIYTLSIHTDYT